MDPDGLKFLASLGVGGVLAGTMFVIYRKDALAWQAAWQGQSQILVQVVKENTAAVTALISKLDERRRDEYGGHRG